MAAQPAECDVLIVGGSLVGLSAAAFLAHHGVSALVVEKHAGTSIHPRAGYFHLGTMEAYRRIGLEPAIRKASEEQFGPDGGLNLVESLAGRELARFIHEVHPGCRTIMVATTGLHVTDRAELAQQVVDAVAGRVDRVGRTSAVDDIAWRPTDAWER